MANNRPTGIRDDLWQVVKEDFNKGSYDHAISGALKFVEHVIQKRLGSSDYGHSLLLAAFSGDQNKIKISEEEVDKRSLLGLFDGAIGFYKGDRSHGEGPVVPIKTKERCIPVLFLACALLDILDADKSLCPKIVAISKSSDELQIHGENFTEKVKCLIDGVVLPVLSILDDKVAVDINNMKPGIHIAELSDAHGKSEKFEFTVRDSDITANWHRVTETNVSLYSDAECTKILKTKGVILESYEGGRHIKRCFPTKKKYNVGSYVTWEWDYDAVRQEAFMRPSRGSAGILAWGSSAYFQGNESAPLFPVRLDSIKLHPSSHHSMRPGEKCPWRVIANYSDGIGFWEKDISNQVKLVSSNQKVVSVNSNGILHATKFGKAVIKVIFENHFDQSEIDVAAINIGDAREYVGGIKHPDKLALSKDGLVITNQTGEVSFVSKKGQFSILTTLNRGYFGGDKLDVIQANDSGEIFARSIGDRAILRIYGSGLGKVEKISLPGDLLPTDFQCEGDSLYILDGKGGIWFYESGKGQPKSIVVSDHDAESFIMVKCLRINNKYFYTLDNMNRLTKISRANLKRSSRIIEGAGNQYSDFVLYKKDIYLSDFYGGKIYLLSKDGVEVSSSGLINPTSIDVDKDGKLYIANFGGETVSIIDLE